jgi:hypothetical protein
MRQLFFFQRKIYIYQSNDVLKRNIFLKDLGFYADFSDSLFLLQVLHINQLFLMLTI